MISSAFTCTGPYAVLIMLGIKRVENRSAMPEPAKGRCAVGCSKSFRKEEFGNFVQWAARALPPEEFDLIPSWSDVAEWPGKIVGTCDYEADGNADGKWNEGYSCWWHLSNVTCFDAPIPCRGNVGMWQMPPALAAQVTAADALARAVGEKVASADDARRLFALAAPIAGGERGAVRASARRGTPRAIRSRSRLARNGDDDCRPDGRGVRGGGQARRGLNRRRAQPSVRRPDAEQGGRGRDREASRGRRTSRREASRPPDPRQRR